MDYYRMKDRMGRVEAYAILDDCIDRVGDIKPIERTDIHGRPAKAWEAFNRDGTSLGVFWGRATAAEKLLETSRRCPLCKGPQ